MREAPFSFYKPTQKRHSRGCWLLTGCLVLAGFSPLLAAPRHAAHHSKRAAIHITAPRLPLPGTISDQVRLLEQSSKFWTISSSQIPGADAQAAMVLSATCEEQARLLEARMAKIQGRRNEAARLVRKAAAARKKWKTALVPKAQTQASAGGMSGMPGMEMGMSGAPGMSGMPMESGMSGAPGMSGPPSMSGPPAPGMSGPPSP